MPIIDDHIKALRDESPRVRQVVASALGNMGDPRVIGPLIEAHQRNSNYGNTYAMPSSDT
jgi:HEAT repeat protein